MDFELSEEQRMFQDSVRGMAERHLAEGALARAHDPGFPLDVMKLIAEQGLIGITIPEADGGQGGTLMDAVLAIEQVALVCPRSADAVQSGNFGPLRTFAEYASDDQKERYFADLLAGEAIIALGMTESEAGSAATDLSTKAVPDGDGFRITGGKVFTSNSPDANLFLIYVRFGEGIDGIGSVLLERGQEGFELGQPATYMNGEEWCALYFDNVYVAPENVLLGPGGFKKQIAGFNAERIGNTSRSLALGQFAFERAREHAETRKQFGRALCEFQGIQWKFADMQIKIDAGRLLLYRAASNADRGLPSAQDTSIAKAFCNQAGFDICNEAMQVMGGTGYSTESLVEYCFRKTRGWQIAGGSGEMMRNRIAEGVFDRRFSQRPPK
ncbi:MAG: acyl-CoA/acyl-ACP dehydrogenase [Alphaproteobacteria bacterium]|mgnify:FL=1|jgi:alkylation response protein AidB-like acyl-CoA dehydrogenase|nr:acyl-CoA/acyl-ACP dehydrogenase [Alphaproteobacteria bacterium]MBT4082790.1 acyl-CoA/acyl-ACP dehydrogenase [Alphaproteobacteria bacterium]MBT4544888.1 acyl-CoA/acyl-ACP dehydrogenase [Alphaproteobacteria bacterium]MBT5920136.1 acyl-CoA/acyl-ACP dehydrogenase [Alphaproteobacteria bacterium]MBT6385776.1 acyl-CoA/acyl-ACP dehydrogenase [Alphaproteobacteria bacterium]